MDIETMCHPVKQVECVNYFKIMVTLILYSLDSIPTHILMKKRKGYLVVFRLNDKPENL